MTWGAFFRVFWPALLWLSIVTVLSCAPTMSLPKFDLLSPDKAGHAISYAVLTYLILRGWTLWYQCKPNARAIILAFGFSAFWGGLMEIVQATLVPGRMCELDDMIANVAGAALIAGLYYLKKM
jgi:VanZ family protein